MKNNFSYLKQVQYMDSITIDNIGNCILKANDDDNNQYYLCIRTVLGVSRIYQIGPIQSLVTTSCFSSFCQLDYDENKISKIIDKFLNDKRDITQVEVLCAETKNDFKNVTDALPDVKDFLYD